MNKLDFLNSLTSEQAKVVNEILEEALQTQREDIVREERERLLQIAKDSLGGHSFTSEPINVANNLLKALMAEPEREE